MLNENEFSDQDEVTSADSHQGEPESENHTIEEMFDEATGLASDENESDHSESESAPATVYRWEYDAQVQYDAQKRAGDSRRGVRNYAIVMTVCFVVSLSLLVGTLLLGWGGALLGVNPGNASDSGGYREIFIRDGVDENALTMQEIAAAGNQVVVAISVKTHGITSFSGSGIVMTSDGYIVTNSHVVHGADELFVQTYDGAHYSASLVGESEQDDLAVIKIRAQGLTMAKFGKSSDALVGDRVVAIGHPASLDLGWTVTFGRLSAINREVKTRDTDGTLIKKMTLLQTDVSVNHGNSGGPMFNDRGEVIGIITSKVEGLSDYSGTYYEGLGFAIPIDAALPLLSALIEKGTTDGVESGVSSGRPQLGITSVMVEEGRFYVLEEDRIQLLTEEAAATTEGSFKAGATGLLVTDVLESVDAYQYLKDGDIMTAIDGIKITSFEVMREHLYDCNIGDIVTIDYVRDGVPGKATVLLGAAQ